MSDIDHSKAGYVRKTPEDRWDETTKLLKRLEGETLENDLPAAEANEDPTFYVRIVSEGKEGFFVQLDSENNLINIEATLGPWQAQQTIEFIRNLPKEPDR
jgi:hypothetical protein